MRQDSELLRRYAEARCQDAFSELVNRHLGLVYSAALRRLGGDSHRAADVAQEVFTRLARDSGRLANHAVLTGWLYTTTRNVAIDAIRSEKRRTARHEEAQAMAELDLGEPSPDWEQIRPELDAVMDRLDRRDREVILMRYFAAQPFREMSSALRISEDAARMRVERALEKLRVLLARRGIRSSASAIGLLLGAEATAAAPSGLAQSIATSASVAAATPVSWGSKIILMTTTQKATAALVVGALLATGLSLREAHGARVATEEAEQSRAAAQAELHKAESLALELSRVRSAVGASVRAETPTEAGVAPAAGANRSPLQVIAEDIAAQSREIENKKARLFFTAEWRRVASRAIPFLEKAGASPAQIEDYMAFAEMELDADRFADGKWTVDGYQVVLEKEWRQKTRDLLGEEAFGRLNRMLAAEAPVSQLANYAARLDIPLEQRQVDRLFDLLANDETVRLPGGKLDWPQVYARSEGILSKPQLTAWQRWNGLREFRRELIERMRNQSKPTTSPNPSS